jgi:hypothetical protein
LGEALWGSHAENICGEDVGGPLEGPYTEYVKRVSLRFCVHIEMSRAYCQSVWMEYIESRERRVWEALQKVHIEISNGKCLGG